MLKIRSRTVPRAPECSKMHSGGCGGLGSNLERPSTPNKNHSTEDKLRDTEMSREQ